MQTAFDICTFDVRRQKLAPEYEKHISGGIAKMASDLISGATFSIPGAKLAASKAAYWVSCLLTEQERMIKFSLTADLAASLKAHRFQKHWGILDRLKGNAETYWYWCEIMKLLPEPEKFLK